MSQNSVRRFEFNDGKSSKFWEIELAVAQFTVRYGKIGTAGQTQVKEFADGAAAVKAVDKLIAEKTGKGYLEVGGAGTKTAPSKSVAPISAKETSPAKAKNPKPADPTEDPAEEPVSHKAAREIMAMPQNFKYRTSAAAERTLAKKQEVLAAAKSLSARLNAEIHSQYRNASPGDIPIDYSPGKLYFGKNLDYAGEAWIPLFAERSFESADRCSGMLIGPLFTSEDHPWPTDANGKLLFPILQLELEAMSALKGLPLGNGLVQVWENEPNFVVRVIPRKDIEKSKLTSYSLDGAAYQEKYRGLWFDEGMYPEVYQIVGAKGPVFSSAERELELDEGDPKEIKALSKMISSLEGNDSGTHFFGTFYPVQYWPCDMGDARPLIALDSELCYYWGDSGTAQLFYQFDGVQPTFFFQWSCY
jgi:predicted DNA-binding WGR domain protein